MSKAQMHFEVDHELKAHWKAFFAFLPRKSETRVLTELMRNFLEKAKSDYKKEISLPELNHRLKAGEAIRFFVDENGIARKETQNVLGTNAVDQQSNREEVHDEPGIAEPEYRFAVGG